MKRREFIAGVGGMALAWPTAARGQQSAKPVVGFITGFSADAGARYVAAFRKGLNQTGHVVEGQNVTVEYHWLEPTGGQSDGRDVLWRQHARCKASSSTSCRRVSTASDTTACAPRRPAPTTSRAPVNCSPGQSPKANPPMLRITTSRHVHVAAAV